MQYSISMEETLPTEQNTLHSTSPQNIHPSQHSHSFSLPTLPSHEAPVTVGETCSIGELEVSAVAGQSIYSTVFAFINQITTTPAILTQILAQFQRIEAQPHTQTPLKTSKLVPTRRVLRNARTSLNQLEDSGEVIREGREGKEGEGRLGRCVRFRGETQSISIKLINSRKNDLSRSALSFKQNQNPTKSIKEETILVEMDSSEQLDRECSPTHSPTSFRRSFKKISIMMFDDVERGSDIFSSQGRISLKDLQLPQLKLTEGLIEDLLDSPSPFLATLTLALLLKFLMRSKFSPMVTQIGWLLGVSSLLAYKIFFDQTIEGLVEYYSRVLGMQTADVRLLERWFLCGLNYEAVISREHYLEVMLRLAPHRAAY